MPRSIRQRLPGPLGGPVPVEDHQVEEGEAAEDAAAPAPEPVPRESIDWESDEILRLEQEATRLRVERAARDARSRARAEEAGARRAVLDASTAAVTAELDAIVEDVRSLLPGAEEWALRLKTAMDAHEARVSAVAPSNPGELSEYRPGVVLERHPIGMMLPLIKMLGARST